MVYVFFDAEGVDDELYGHFLRGVPEFRREAVVRHRRRCDRVNSLCAYVLLAAALGKRPESFSYGEHGKPFVPGGPCFSITHTDGCVAVGVSPDLIGVDAERVLARPSEVAERFFTPSELRHIESAEDADDAFFALWTLKECYCKILGAGLSFGPLAVEFVFDEHGGVVCSDSRFVFSSRAFGRWRLGVGGVGGEEVSVVDLPTLRRLWERL